MEKVNLKKGDIIEYHTTGLITKATVMENDCEHKELKIMLVYRKPIWVSYDEIEIANIK